MLISIWNYFRGYVMIEVAGFSVERFLNLAVHRDIYIWDIERQKSKVTMKVGVKGYKLLKPCAHKTGCRMRMIRKEGLPFIKFRYRKRKMIPIGILIFIALIYTMAAFVWVVEVEGNKRVTSEAIAGELSQNGYKVGAIKKKMNLREAEAIILKKFPDILWTGVSFEGTKLIVEITEIVPEPKLIDYSSPAHIVATRDGLILDIITRRGTPQVKKGDTVQKGDVLVSSKVPLSDEWDDDPQVAYTRASADIIAKTHYTLKGQLPLKKTKKEYTGVVKKAYHIRLLDKKINIYKANLDLAHYDQVISSKQLKITKNFPLPLYWNWEHYIEYRPQIEKLSKELAKEELTIMLSDLLQDEIHKNSKILKQEINFIVKDDIMFARLLAIVEEEFGEELRTTIHDGRKQGNDK